MTTTKPPSGMQSKNEAIRRIIFNLLIIDLTETRTLLKKRRRAVPDLTYCNPLLSFA